MPAGILPLAVAFIVALALYGAGPGSACAGDEGSHRGRLSSPSDRSQPSTGNSVDSLTRQMLSDPESQRLIIKLQKDPNLQRILRDPELLKAIGEQDLGRVAQDPKIQALQNNENLRKLIERNQ